MSTNFTKAELRKELLAKRKQLDRDDVAKRSKAICTPLSELVKSGDKIHCFLPIVGDNEPDLRQFISDASQKAIRIYITNPPKAIKATDIELIDYQLGDSTNFDLIIVPMLGFKGNHRLGFGGGFYDRMLASQPHAQKIGVCFKEFELQDLQIEPHDYPLDKIIAV